MFSNDSKKVFEQDKKSTDAATDVKPVQAEAVTPPSKEQAAPLEQVQTEPKQESVPTAQIPSNKPRETVLQSNEQEEDNASLAKYADLPSRSKDDWESVLKDNPGIENADFYTRERAFAKAQGGEEAEAILAKIDKEEDIFKKILLSVAKKDINSMSDKEAQCYFMALEQTSPLFGFTDDYDGRMMFGSEAGTGRENLSRLLSFFTGKDQRALFSSEFKTFLDMADEEKAKVAGGFKWGLAHPSKSFASDEERIKAHTEELFGKQSSYRFASVMSVLSPLGRQIVLDGIKDGKISAKALRLLDDAECDMALTAFRAMKPASSADNVITQAPLAFWDGAVDAGQGVWRSIVATYHSIDNSIGSSQHTPKQKHDIEEYEHDQLRQLQVEQANARTFDQEGRTWLSKGIVGVAGSIPLMAEYAVPGVGSTLAVLSMANDVREEMILAGADADTATALCLPFGFALNLVEKQQLIGAIGKGGLAAKRVMIPAVLRWLKSKAYKDAFKVTGRMLLNGALTAIGESAEEGAQGGLTQVGVELAKKIADAEHELNYGDILDRTVGDFAESIPTSLYFGASGASGLGSYMRNKVTPESKRVVGGLYEYLHDFKKAQDVVYSHVENKVADSFIGPVQRDETGAVVRDEAFRDQVAEEVKKEMDSVRESWYNAKTQSDKLRVMGDYGFTQDQAAVINNALEIEEAYSWGNRWFKAITGVESRDKGGWFIKPTAQREQYEMPKDLTEALFYTFYGEDGLDLVTGMANAEELPRYMKAVKSVKRNKDGSFDVELRLAEDKTVKINIRRTKREVFAENRDERLESEARQAWNASAERVKAFGEWDALDDDTKVAFLSRYTNANTIISAKGSSVPYDAVITLAGPNIGKMDVGATTQNLLHEFFHAATLIAKNEGILSEEDLAKMKEAFGEGENKGDYFNEEKAADAFGEWAYKNGSEATGGVFSKVREFFGGIVNAMRVRQELAERTEEVYNAENIFAKIKSGDLRGIPALSGVKVTEGEATKTEEASKPAQADAKEESTPTETAASTQADEAKEDVTRGSISVDGVMDIEYKDTQVSPLDLVLPDEDGYDEALKANANIVGHEPMDGVPLVAGGGNVVMGADIVREARARGDETLRIQRVDGITLKGGVSLEDALKRADEEVGKENVERRYSVNFIDYAEWNSVLDAYERGEIEAKRRIIVSKNTPVVLQHLGVPNLPVTITGHILDKITGKVQTKSGDFHNIPVSELRELQIELDNPIAVFDSLTQPNSFVIYTRMVDRNNNERAVVALKVGVTATSLSINPIMSAYGKQTFKIQDWVDANSLRYINKQARKTYAHRLQLPGDSVLRARRVLTEKDFSSEQLGILNYPVAKFNKENSNLQIPPSGKQKEANTAYPDAADDIRYSLVSDREIIDEFDDPTKYIETYRTFQIVNGKLYSPMAAKMPVQVEIKSGKNKGKMRTVYKWTDPVELGKAYKADERPDIAVLRPSNGKYYVTLNKGDGTSLSVDKDGNGGVAYNPYWHSSNLVLNDQFTRAWRRANLVTVKCRILKSDIGSGYHAEKAHNPVGRMPWHVGPVAAQLEDNTRDVYLSRYLMPVEIIDDADVAKMYKETFAGKDIAVPEEVVPPSLKDALLKEGIRVIPRTDEGVRYSIGPSMNAALDRFSKGEDAEIDTSIGKVSYGFGTPGTITKSGKIAHGHGLLHIVYARMAKDGESFDRAIETAIRVGDAIENGNVDRTKANKTAFQRNGYEGIVAKNYDGKLVVTGYKVEADVAGGDKLVPRELRASPIPRKEDVVAALPHIIAKIRGERQTGTSVDTSRSAPRFSISPDYINPLDLVVAVTSDKIRRGVAVDEPSVRQTLLDIGQSPNISYDILARAKQTVRMSKQSFVDSILDKAKSDPQFVRFATNKEKARRILAMAERIGKEGRKLTQSEKADAEKLLAELGRVAREIMEAAQGFKAGTMENKYGFDIVDTVVNSGTGKRIEPYKPADKQDKPGEVNGEGLSFDPDAEEAAAKEKAEAEAVVTVPAEESAALKDLLAESERIAAKIEKKYDLDPKEGVSPEQKQKNHEQILANADAEEAEAAAQEAGEEGEEGLTGEGEEKPKKRRRKQIAKETLNAMRPSQFLGFVEATVLKELKDAGELYAGRDPWQPAPNRRQLLNTAKHWLAKILKKRCYSRGREILMKRLAEMDTAESLEAIEAAIMNNYAAIKDQLIPQTQDELIKNLEREIKKLSFTGKRFSRNGEERDRKVRTEVEKWARDVRKYLRMTPEQIAEELTRLDGIIHKREDVAQQQSDTFKIENDRDWQNAVDLKNALTQYGGLINKKPAEILAKSDEILEQINGSREELENMRFEERARTQMISNILAEAMKNPIAIAENKKADPSKASLFFDSLIGVLDLRLRELIKYSTGETRARAERALQGISDEIARASENFNNYLSRNKKSLEEQLTQIYGTSSRNAVRRLFEDIDETDRRLITKQGSAHINRAQLLQMYVSLLQEEDYVQGIAYNKRTGEWRQAFDRVIAKYITPEDMRLVGYLRDWYRKNLDEINDKVLVPISGIKQYSPGENYFPVKMKQKERQGLVGKAKAWTPYPQWLTPRVKSNLDFDEGADILTMWMSRMKDSGRAVAYSTLGVELGDIFANPQIKEEIKFSHGEEAYKRLNEHIIDIISGGAQELAESDSSTAVADNLRAIMTEMTLSGNLVSAIKQAASSPVFALRHDVGLADVGKYLLTAWTPEGFEAMGILMKSDGWHARYDNGYSEALQNALQRTQKSGSSLGDFLRLLYAKGFRVIEWGDRVPGLLVGQGLLRKNIKSIIDEQGGTTRMTQDEIVKLALTRTWAQIETTQQSKRTENLAASQRGGSWGRFGYQFVSASVQQAAYEVQAFNEADAQIKATGSVPPQVLNKIFRTILVNHVLIPNLLKMFGLGAQYLLMGKKQKDDEPIYATITEMLLGSFSSIIIGGQMAGAMLDAAFTGKRPYGNKTFLPVEGMSKTLVDAVMVGRHIFGIKTDDFQEDFVRLLKDIGAPVRDAITAYENYLGDGEY